MLLHGHDQEKCQSFTNLMNEITIKQAQKGSTEKSAPSVDKKASIVSATPNGAVWKDERPRLLQTMTAFTGVPCALGATSLFKRSTNANILVSNIKISNFELS